MLIRTRKTIIALVAAAVLAVTSIAPAFAGSVTLVSSSCTGAGGSTMAQTNGLAYTTGCSDYQRYNYPGWSGSYGYIDGTAIWDTQDLNIFGPSGTTHVGSSHNLCTNSFGSCNGYISTSS